MNTIGILEEAERGWSRRNNWNNDGGKYSKNQWQQNIDPGIEKTHSRINAKKYESMLMPFKKRKSRRTCFLQKSEDKSPYLDRNNYGGLWTETVQARRQWNIQNT